MASRLSRLLASIALCLGAGFLGSLFTVSSIPTWYASLSKPWFTPPNWLFAPAWTTLYLLMAVSLFLVWEKGLETRQAKTAVSFFGLQLALNALWPIIFFGFQNPMIAFFEVAFLWAAIALTIYNFYPLSRKASLLLVPYIAWVGFAAALNFSVWVLNA